MTMIIQQLEQIASDARKMREQCQDALTALDDMRKRQEECNKRIDTALCAMLDAVNSIYQHNNPQT